MWRTLEWEFWLISKKARWCGQLSKADVYASGKDPGWICRFRLVCVCRKMVLEFSPRLVAPLESNLVNPRRIAVIVSPSESFEVIP